MRLRIIVQDVSVICILHLLIYFLDNQDPCLLIIFSFLMLVDLGHNNNEKEVWWKRLLLCCHRDPGLLIVHSISGNSHVQLSPLCCLASHDCILLHSSMIFPLLQKKYSRSQTKFDYCQSCVALQVELAQTCQDCNQLQDGDVVQSSKKLLQVEHCTAIVLACIGPLSFLNMMAHSSRKNV